MAKKAKKSAAKKKPAKKTSKASKNRGNGAKGGKGGKGGKGAISSDLHEASFFVADGIFDHRIGVERVEKGSLALIKRTRRIF